MFTTLPFDCLLGDDIAEAEEGSGSGDLSRKRSLRELSLVPESCQRTPNHIVRVHPKAGRAREGYILMNAAILTIVLCSGKWWVSTGVLSRE